eukprot:COSAG01_NODE_7110_length_3341_cov_8.571736_6_plen_34_part_01
MDGKVYEMHRGISSHFVLIDNPVGGRGGSSRGSR